ncbi:TPA: hypothetical protein SMI33_002738 [Serratia marcescens]|nr:hypothetical protein [Serratia marcescens]
MTLTIEELKYGAEVGDLGIDAVRAVCAEALANREAQPAGFYTTVSGRKGVVWHNGAPEDDTAIYTAPPAPAVPDEAYSDDCPDLYPSQPDAWAAGWNACRAAMLAQPVSSGYALPEGWNDHDTGR